MTVTPTPNLTSTAVIVALSAALVTLSLCHSMTRPDLAWSYSELSKYVQFPGIAHMEVAEHVLQYLCDTWNEQ